MLRKVRDRFLILLAVVVVTCTAIAFFTFLKGDNSDKYSENNSTITAEATTATSIMLIGIKDSDYVTVDIMNGSTTDKEFFKGHNAWQGTGSWSLSNGTLELTNSSVTINSGDSLNICVWRGKEISSNSEAEMFNRPIMYWTESKYSYDGSSSNISLNVTAGETFSKYIGEPNVISTSNTTLTYTGSQQTLEVSAIYPEASGTFASEYTNIFTLSGNTGTNVGSYTATLSTSGNVYMCDWTTGDNPCLSYTSKTQSLSVNWSITGGTVTAPSNKTVGAYKGAAYSMPDDFKNDGWTASGDTGNKTNAGTYKVTLTLKTGYLWGDGTTGTKTVSWTISKADISPSLSVDSYTYGSPSAPTISGNKGNGGVTYYYDTDTSTGNVWDTKETLPVGTYSVYATIAGTDNYNGKTTDKVSLTVSKKEITPTITLSQDTYTYDGTAKTPTVTVKDESTPLTENTDYTVTYSNNTNAGTAAKVTVTLQGNYSGSNTANFTINKKDASKATITLSINGSEMSKEGGHYIYSTNALVLTPPNVTMTIKDGSTTLTANTDYKVTWTGRDKYGIARAAITFDGNYTGSAKTEYAINYSGTMLIGRTVHVQTILKFYAPKGYEETTKDDWDVQLYKYDSAEKYYSDLGDGSLESINKITVSKSGSTGYVQVTSTNDYWPLAIKHSSAALNKVGLNFIVAKFTYNKTTLGEKVVDFAGYVYHINNGNDYFIAVEGYDSTVQGKTVVEGGSETSVSSSLSFKTTTVSTSITYGTSATVCSFTPKGNTGNCTYTVATDYAKKFYIDSSTNQLHTYDNTPAGNYYIPITCTDSGGNKVEQLVSVTVEKKGVSSPTLISDGKPTEKANSIKSLDTALSVATTLCTEGQGFVVWDWTGFEYINGKYIVAKTGSSTSTPVPRAYLYTRLNGTITRVELTITATAGKDGSYTAKATCNDYDLADTYCIDIGLKTYTDLNKDGKITLEEIANTSEKSFDETVANTVAQTGQETEYSYYKNYNGGFALDENNNKIVESTTVYKLANGEYKYTVVISEQECAKAVISEKIAALKEIVEEKDSADGTKNSGSLEFYTDGTDSEGNPTGTYAEAVTAIRSLIDKYKTTYTDDYSDGTNATDFAAIEAANTFATETAKTALGYAADYAENKDSYFSSLSDEELKAQDGALDTALTAYIALSSNTAKNYLLDEKKALNDARKASAKEILNRLITTVNSATVNGVAIDNDTKKLVTDKITESINTIGDLNSADDITATITGILNGMSEKWDAVQTLYAMRSTTSDNVNTAVTNAVTAVLSLTDKTGTAPLFTTDVENIKAACTDICEKITELERQKSTLTGEETSALTDDTDDTDGQKTTVTKLVDDAIKALNGIPYTKDDSGKIVAEGQTTVIGSAKEIYSPVNTKLAAVETLNKEKIAEKNGNNSANVIGEIDEAINKVLALTSSDSALTGEIKKINEAKEGIIAAVKKAEAAQKDFIAASDDNGKLNGSELLSTENVEKIKTLIEKNIKAICGLTYSGTGDNTDLSKASIAATNTEALAETFVELTAKEKETRALKADGKLSKNVTDVFNTVYTQALTEGKVNTDTATDDYQTDSTIAEKLNKIKTYAVGDDKGTPDDTSDDDMGTVEAVVTLEECIDKINDSTTLLKLGDGQYKTKLETLLNDDIKKIMGGPLSDGTTTETGYLDPISNTEKNNADIKDIVKFAESKTEAAIEFADDSASGSDDVKDIAGAAIVKIFEVSETATDRTKQVTKIKESAGKVIDGIQALEKVRDKLVGKEDTETLKDIEVTGDTDKTTVRTFLNEGIKIIKDLSYSGTDAVDEAKITAITDELSKKAEAIAALEADKTKDGATRSGNVISEIEKAKTKIYSLDYVRDATYLGGNVTEEIADISDFAAEKIKTIEAIEKLIADTEASLSLTEEEKTTLKDSLNKGLESAIAKPYSTTDEDNAANVAKLEKLVENLTAKTGRR